MDYHFVVVFSNFIHSHPKSGDHKMIMLYGVSDNMCTDMTLAQCADEKKKNNKFVHHSKKVQETLDASKVVMKIQKQTEDNIADLT